MEAIRAKTENKVSCSCAAIEVTRMRERKSCRVAGHGFRRHIAQKQEGEAGRRSRKEKQKGEMRSPVIIGSKALLREATFVGRSCGIDQLVDEVAFVFVKGDKTVEHKLVEISLPPWPASLLALSCTSRHTSLGIVM